VLSKRNQYEMKDSGMCPKCGGTKIAGPHRIGGEGYTKIDLPGFYTATLEAITCAECGYTELYADRIGLDNLRRDGRFLHNPQSSKIPTSMDSTFQGELHESGRRKVDRCTFCGTKARPGSDFCLECGRILEDE
jgi:predicted nucleic-acid-binding Zn-ribbon protein